MAGSPINLVIARPQSFLGGDRVYSIGALLLAIAYGGVIALGESLDVALSTGTLLFLCPHFMSVRTRRRDIHAGRVFLLGWR